jgi:hypothetical protein
MDPVVCGEFLSRETSITALTTRGIRQEHGPGIGSGLISEARVQLVVDGDGDGVTSQPVLMLEQGQVRSNR